MPSGGKSDGSGGRRLTSAPRRTPALVTQFAVPPAPFGMVDRARLRLTVDEPVTLVCAPAGSGKTALSRRRCSARRTPRRGSRSSPPTTSPATSGTRCSTALDLAGAVPGDSPVAALAAPVRESRNAFMPLLVNALATLPERVVLVLDDVHVLRNNECLTQLSFLLLHAPDTLRLVLTARSDPALPLHVLRVRGRLAEIRATDLAFTECETHELLQAHGLTLDQELVKALHSRTEGWGAGLRLAALSLQGREDPDRFVAEFAGDDRVIADYLVAEVLDRQPPRLRAFLLRTALVDRVCGSLADALTGESNGADTLATLERTNGFVLGVDGHREWFRYHRLFAKLLRTRAERELAAKLPDLHARAARWYAARGASVDALGHAVAGARVGPGGGGRRRPLVRPVRARRRRRGPRAAEPAPTGPARAGRRTGRGARVRGARRRRHRGRRAPPGARRAGAGA